MTILRWPAEKFYWAVIDGLGWSRTGQLPDGLLPALADELPVPLADVHAVAMPLTETPDRLLVCACPRTLLADLSPSIVSLAPEAVPALFGVGGDLTGLNLLVGEFEPTPIRTARRSRHVRAACTVLACIALASIGLFRRSAHANSEAEQAGQAASSLLAALTLDRREETLAAQVRAMKSVVDAAAREKPPTDAASALEVFLAAWPTSIPSKPLSVSVSSEGLSCAVVVEGDPTPLLKAIKPPSGYVLTEPRITSAGAVTRVNLLLRLESKGGPRQ